ncbi:MAG: glycosyltransferase [Planctomycetota bacterium]|jgi:glycosyltransferase involved in cell wall biosynthesis
MKIVHINSEFSWGGGEAQTYYLVKGLENRGIENILIAQPNSALAEKVKEGQIKLIEIYMKGEWDIVAVLKLRKILKKIKPDVLHLHTSHAHTLGLLAGKLAKAKKIVATRRMDFPIGGFFSRLKYNKVDKIVGISEIIKEILVRGGVKEEKITVIYSAADRAPVTEKSDLQERLGLKRDYRILGTVASLVERKGHRYLFEATVKVKEEFPQIKLLVVGEGPLKKDLKKLAEKLSSENEIIFTGFRKDIPEILSILDVFVSASLKEGLGVSLLEAANYGLPIVATNAGGIPEVVEDGVTGFLVPPKDSEALAEKIIYLLSHPKEARKMGENGKERVRKNFSVEQMVNSYTKLYEGFIRQE